MLVVIAILGILAAVATMSMAGVTNLAQRRAQDAELATLQSAMNFMIMDQEIDPAQACDGTPAAGTDDMSQFPDASAWVTQGGGSPVDLYPHYVRKRMMTRRYICINGGTVEPAPGG
jgi:type II secretory pathway pseudopilin PulG